MRKKEKISVVWLKRDLRLHDNEAISSALNKANRVLLLYVFEDSLRDDPHYNERHFNFIKESLVDLNSSLAAFNSKVLIVQGEVIPVFNKLLSSYKIEEIFSHQETGILVTYYRDQSIKRFCKNNLIIWRENINNGVFRGLKNRKGWALKWKDYMLSKPFVFDDSDHKLFSRDEVENLEKSFAVPSLTTPTVSNFQKGGTRMAEKYLSTFFESRYRNYMLHISKPLLSRKGCSRVSPYMAWGNLSIRQVFQKALARRDQTSNTKPLDAFISRLQWQAHFIQKFEMEDTMEFLSLNKGYHELKKDISEEYQDAWKKGMTGYPLVDACMRCLNETGYLNFRMRALVVSFFTHNLWQPWQDATKHLSQMFLDFEPGIHYPQLQMQAGETGINMIRIYNPVKNSHEHDPDAVFIKKWVPELAKLDIHFAHEPYNMTRIEQILNEFELGKDYPRPIVDLQLSRKKASDILWKMRKDEKVREENFRILEKHTMDKRTRSFS